MKDRMVILKIMGYKKKNIIRVNLVHFEFFFSVLIWPTSIMFTVLIHVTLFTLHSK